MSTSVLGFSVRIARHEAELREACALRAQAYGHHVPGLAQALSEPDAIDRQPGCLVLVCRDKASGELVGTARLQHNLGRPLAIEASVALPQALAAQARAEITRLAIRAGADPLVRSMLMKACYLAAVASQTRLLVIGARSPALIRIYRHLGFTDLLADGQQVPLAHAGGLPHNVLTFDVVAAERHWFAAGHALYAFMVETRHPDLQLLAEAPAQAAPAALRAADGFGSMALRRAARWRLRVADGRPPALAPRRQAGATERPLTGAAPPRRAGLRPAAPG
jgi:hypothetical protein